MSYSNKQGIAVSRTILTNPSMIPEPKAITDATITVATTTKHVRIKDLANKDAIGVGDYIWDNTNHEGRKVLHIDVPNPDAVDTDAYRYALIESTFTNNITDADLYVVESGQYRDVEVTSSGDTATIEGEPIGSATPWQKRSEGGLEPLLVDPNGETVEVRAMV